MRVYAFVCMCVCVFVCACAPARVEVCAYVCVCAHVLVYVCVRVRERERYSLFVHFGELFLKCVAESRIVLQCVAVRYSVKQHAAVCLRCVCVCLMSLALV